MEKDNKYYSVIENLVKTHKKYNGYDAILDDIIDDVYKHSKTVVNTVKDEEVVLSYLQKLVAISIVTVPKRLNFKTELKYRSIPQEMPTTSQMPDISEKTEVFQPEINNISEELKAEKFEDNSVQKADVELVDKMINSIDNSSISNKTEIDNSDDLYNDDIIETLQLSEEESFEQPLQEDDNLEMFAEYEIETQESDIDNLNITDNQTLDSEQEDVLSETNLCDDSEESAVYNDTFVDFKTEESESVEFDEKNEDNDEIIESVSETFELAESDDEETFANNTDFEADAEKIDFVEPQNVEIFNIDDVDEQEAVTEELEESDNDDVFDINSVEIEPVTEEPEVAETDDDIFEISNVELESAQEESEFTDTDVVDISNSALETAQTEIQPIESEEGLSSDDIDDLAPVSENVELDFNNVDSDIKLFEENENDILEPNSGEDSPIINELIEETAPENSVEDNAEEVPVYKSVDYSLFDYMPQVSDVDADVQVLENKLIDLNTQKPELNVLKIFDLKYKQNLPIAKIAEELNLEKQDVLSALDEIVELI